MPHWGATLEYWDAGSIPSPAQWVNDPALLQLRQRSKLHLGSDGWPQNSLCQAAAEKEGKRQRSACGPNTITFGSSEVLNSAELDEECSLACPFISSCNGTTSPNTASLYSKHETMSIK